MIAAGAGAERVIVANQIVDPVQLEALAALADENAVDIAVFVDSLTGIDRVAERAAGAQRLSVFVEMGMSGGRTGVRTEDELFGLLERVAGDDAVQLAGVSAFEGLLPVIRRPLPEASGGGGPNTGPVEEYLATVAAAIGGARSRGLLGETAIVTAGGSSAFDLVVAALRDVAGPLVLRSGCYVTHDHGLYMYQSPLQEGNDPALDRGAALRPALSVWAHVVSAPEPGAVVVGLGRRDVGDDFGMPSPTGRVLGPGGREPVDGWAVTRLWDQHARMDADASATALAVGDVLTFGISHPCTTFDKWRTLVELDDDDGVLGTVETRF
jgi:D-serine dehydratase